MQITVKVRASMDNFQELYQALQGFLPIIRKEEGCLDCHIYRDVEDGQILFLSVRWESRAGLEHFIRSESGSALIGAIDLLSDIARVAFGKDSSWQEIDTLKKMRKKHNEDPMVKH